MIHPVKLNIVASHLTKSAKAGPSFGVFGEGHRPVPTFTAAAKSICPTLGSQVGKYAKRKGHNES